MYNERTHRFKETNSISAYTIYNQLIPKPLKTEKPTLLCGTQIKGGRGYVELAAFLN
jgi:hypothetical protein